MSKALDGGGGGGKTGGRRMRVQSAVTVHQNSSKGEKVRFQPSNSDLGKCRGAHIAKNWPKEDRATVGVVLTE